MRVWCNGSLLGDAGTPVLPVTDHGLTVGDGIFETIKVVEGRPFALTRHLERLDHSAAGLGLALVDRDRLREGIDAVLAEEAPTFGRLRITVTAGPGPMGSARGDAGPTVVVVAVPMEPQPPTTTVVTVPWTRNERSAVAGLKTTSYAENVVALARAAEHGGSEALFANTRGDLCEGTGSNVFYVVDGEVRTPTLASGCLAGVTRALAIEWFDVREVDAPLSVLETADEVFLTSTTRDVQAVARVDGRDLPAPGPVTHELAEQWRLREAEGIDP